jgi:hypothetical protein
METIDHAPYHVAEERIAQLTLVLGALASVGAALLFSIRIGAGVLIGAILGWINFRWLKAGLDAVMRVATAQAGSPNPKLPVGSLIQLLGRYSLIALSVCVIFIFFKIPVLSMIVGMCALGAATIVASLYEVFQGWNS